MIVNIVDGAFGNRICLAQKYYSVIESLKIAKQERALSVDQQGN